MFTIRDRLSSTATRAGASASASRRWADDENILICFLYCKRTVGPPACLTRPTRRTTRRIEVSSIRSTLHNTTPPSFFLCLARSPACSTRPTRTPTPWPGAHVHASPPQPSPPPVIGALLGRVYCLLEQNAGPLDHRYRGAVRVPALCWARKGGVFFRAIIDPPQSACLNRMPRPPFSFGRSSPSPFPQFVVMRYSR